MMAKPVRIRSPVIGHSSMVECRSCKCTVRWAVSSSGICGFRSHLRQSWSGSGCGSVSRGHQRSPPRSDVGGAGERQRDWGEPRPEWFPSSSRFTGTTDRAGEGGGFCGVAPAKSGPCAAAGQHVASASPELLQGDDRGVDHRDVVGGGVGAGIAWTQ